jgi:hypothetical protein
MFTSSILALEEKTKETTQAYEAKTGDVEFDTVLGNLNIEAQGNLSEFITNLSVEYKVPEEEIEEIIVEEEMTPADAYMTLEIADIIDEPVDVVVEEYKINKEKGWGFIAKQLGIKPGSKEFHELKNGGVTELEKAKDKGKDKEKAEKSEKGKKDKEKKGKKK